jgi:hypothetical protein
MGDFEVKVSGADVTVTHLKYKHKWLFPRTLAPQYMSVAQMCTKSLEQILVLRDSLTTPGSSPLNRYRKWRRSPSF